MPRREALAALRERTDVPELASFVVALVQSDQMGIALADVLKSQAGQVRLKRRQRAKEQAAKTPVKILFPVVLGIFPALFVVTIGPGAIKIAEGLLRGSSMSGNIWSRSVTSCHVRGGDHVDHQCRKRHLPEPPSRRNPMLKLLDRAQHPRRRARRPHARRAR